MKIKKKLNVIKLKVWSLFGPVLFSANPFQLSFDMKSGPKSAKLGVIKRCLSGICRPTFNILDYDSLCNGVKVVKVWLLHIKEAFVSIWYFGLIAVLIKCAVNYRTVCLTSDFFLWKQYFDDCYTIV